MEFVNADVSDHFGEVEINAMCSTCLSVDRNLKMYSREDPLFKIFELNLEQWSYKTLSLCWECSTLLKRFIKFKQKALLALEAMNGIIEIKSMSTLKISQMSVHTYACDMDEGSGFDLKCEVSGFENDDAGTNTPEPTHDVTKEICKVKRSTKRKEPKQSKPKSTPSRMSTRKIKHIPTIDTDEDMDSADPADMISAADECKQDEHLDELDLDPANRTKRVWIGTPKHWSDKYTTYLMPHAELLQVLEEERQKNRYLSLPYKCESCIWSYVSETELEKHKKRFHTEKKGYTRCHVCERYLHPSAYKSHRNEHYTMYVCTICMARCYREAKVHYSRRHGINHYTCYECDGGFATERAFRYHCVTEHGGKYPCGICGKVYSTRDEQKDHESTHEQVPVEECPICQLQIKGKYAFTNHILRHNSDHPNKAIKSEEKTEQTKKADKSENYCAECDKQFKDEQLYRQHLTRTIRHLPPGERKFECPDCDRKFLSTYFVKIHRVRAHVKTRNIQCEICNKKYLTRIDLTRHIKYVHDKWRPARDKMCSYCGKAFLTKQNLEQHIRIHTGERPYQCTLCASSFTHQGSLVTHNKLVHLKIKRRKYTNVKRQEKITSKVEVLKPTWVNEEPN